MKNRKCKKKKKKENWVWGLGGGGLNFQIFKTEKKNLEKFQ